MPATAMSPGGRQMAQMPAGVKAGLGYESVAGAQRLGFYLLVWFLFMAFSRIGDFFLYYLHLPMIASTLALGFCVLTRGLERAMQTKVGMLLLGFSAWMLVGLPFSQWKGGSWAAFVGVWSKSLLAYFLVAGLVLTTKNARTAMNTLAFTSFVIVILARIWAVTGVDGRLYVMGESTLSNPNDLAQLLLVGLPFLYLILTTSSMAGKIFALVTMPVVAYTISATGSRGALMAIVVMASVIFWNATTANKIKGIIVMMLFVGALVVLVPGKLKQRYSTIFSGDAASAEDAMAVESREQRWVLLKQSLKFTATHPIFGVGLGQFTVASKDDMASQGRGAMWRETHNAYTQVSSETGIPGFLLYYGCLLIAFRLMNRLKRATRNQPKFQNLYKMAYAMHLSLLSFAVTSFFSSVGYAHFLPSLLGLTVALYQAAAYELGVHGIQLTAEPGRLFSMPARRLAPNTAMGFDPLVPARRS